MSQGGDGAQRTTWTIMQTVCCVGRAHNSMNAVQPAADGRSRRTFAAPSPRPLLSPPSPSPRLPPPLSPPPPSPPRSQPTRASAAVAARPVAYEQTAAHTRALSSPWHEVQHIKMCPDQTMSSGFGHTCSTSAAAKLERCKAAHDAEATARASFVVEDPRIVLRWSMVPKGRGCALKSRGRELFSALREARGPRQGRWHGEVYFWSDFSRTAVTARWLSRATSCS